MPKDTRWGSIENPTHRWVPEAAWDWLVPLEAMIGHYKADLEPSPFRW